MRVPQILLSRVLRGVAAATGSRPAETAPIERWISSIRTVEGSLLDWKAATSGSLTETDGEKTVHLANMVLAICYLREATRKSHDISPAELSQCWEVVRAAMGVFGKDKSLGGFPVSSSLQGLSTVSLCELSENGSSGEQFHLHIGMPSGSRLSRGFDLHSSLSPVHTWVLAGEVRNDSYQVDSVTDPAEATHATYTLFRSSAEPKGDTRTSVPLEKHIVVEKAGKLVRAREVGSKTHTRNASYSLPADAFQTVEVDPDTLFAALTFSETSRGSATDTVVLGPIEGNLSIELPSPTTLAPRELADLVESARSWEGLIEEGREHARKAEWEYALQAFNSALSLCGPEKSFPNAGFYRHLVLGEIGSVNRRFGRYESARSFLEEAINGLKPCIQRTEFSGELGVTYRHIGQLENASDAFSKQYEVAKELGSAREMCRAVGNMGMINYQLSQRDGSETLLDQAIAQLQERVSLAEDLKRTASLQAGNSSSKHWLHIFETWKTIGLCRLSICHYTRGNVEKAIVTSAEALEMTAGSKDVTVKAMTRFFHGRALIKGGRQEEALALFNMPGTCSPAIAFAKEPSEEHRGYLQELVDIGADLDIVDEQGYTALDHAVFSGDAMTEAVILKGLRKTSEENVAERQMEARLRKGYRELFQEKLRPVLLGGGRHVLSKLRKAYAESLETDETKKRAFDGLKFMWYSDFLDFKRLPRSDDGLVREFDSSWTVESAARAAEKVVFISYRWINKMPGAKSPDDDHHTQYRRMINAIDEYLRLTPSVHKDKLGIWMDHACVNQDDPNAGVSALPMIIAQCDAMISLVDEDYYDRGWCAVEVMMAETLRSSYSIHQWYEHVLQPGGSRVQGVLREAPDRPIGMMKDKRLTFETDRPKVLFLERQSKLLR
ncbi:Putative tetratricopeptide-like helical domain superfamily [Colletotrichum destructivum]|uniref:Tetratricopeptide-like helical domain superfamily n=1 Tax=Colletotrichum destructivum TaxID=34406 RepID=A0AAX4HW26_9PEZI|nr:Putative tetratricopeptide-like helical domain superfamily [Colletotrichum destructivum]